MITISQPLITPSGAIMPAGVRLTFDSKGTTKFQNETILRASIPTFAIKGAAGPFTEVAKAKVLNDNIYFQRDVNMKFPDYAHVVIYEGFAIVYIWDTREVINVIDLRRFATEQPIMKKLKSKTTDEVIEQKIGSIKPWLSQLIDMMLWKQYHAVDNGMQLVIKNKNLNAEPVNKLNKLIKTKYSYESVGYDSVASSNQGVYYNDNKNASGAFDDNQMSRMQPKPSSLNYPTTQLGMLSVPFGYTEQTNKMPTECCSEPVCQMDEPKAITSDYNVPTLYIGDQDAYWTYKDNRVVLIDRGIVKANILYNDKMLAKIAEKMFGLTNELTLQGTNRYTTTNDFKGYLRTIANYKQYN